MTTTQATIQTDPTPEQVEAAFDREDREADRIAELEAADAERAQPGVAFVGCAASGRVLRVRVANRTRQRMSVECPHCAEGVHSTSKAMARPLLDGEPEPELVEIPPDDLERDLQDRGSGSRKVSDAAIFRAIPVGGEVVATEVADALGYANAPGRRSSAAALLARLRRMNRRAEKDGVPPPFTFTRRALGAAGGNSVVISRATKGASNA